MVGRTISGYPQHFTVHLFRNPQIPVGSKSDRQRVCVPQPKTLQPKKVLFRQNYMTSVLAVRQKAWMVFFIGTGDGQLIKVCAKSDMYLLLEKDQIYSEPVVQQHVTACTRGCTRSWLFLQPLCFVIGLLKTVNGKNKKNPCRCSKMLPLLF